MADGLVAVTMGGRSKRRPYEENSGSGRWGVQVADGFGAVTFGGRSKPRPYEENSRRAGWGVDGRDFGIANSDLAACFAGATYKEEIR